MRELQNDQIYNHLDGINAIANKSGLFSTLKDYCDFHNLEVFNYVPETHVIHLDRTYSNETNYELEEFKEVFGNHIWIMKPGENSNRGHGIQILNSLEKIVSAVT